MYFILNKGQGDKSKMSKISEEACKSPEGYLQMWMSCFIKKI